MKKAADKWDCTIVDCETVFDIEERISNILKGNAVAIGRELLKAKGLLGHGEFGSWLKKKFGWSQKTAQNMMNAAALADSKGEIFSHLPKSALYLLAAKSTPQGVQDEVLAELIQGIEPAISTISQKIQAHKAAELAAETSLSASDDDTTEAKTDKTATYEIWQEFEFDDANIAEAVFTDVANTALNFLLTNLGAKKLAKFVALYRKTPDAFIDAVFTEWEQANAKKSSQL